MRASERTSLFWSSRSWNKAASPPISTADFFDWIDRHAGGAGSTCRLAWILRATARALSTGGGRFLRGGQFQALLDAGDLHVAEQRVILLRLRLGCRLRLRRCGLGKLRHAEVGRRARGIGLTQRPGQDRRLILGLGLGFGLSLNLRFGRLERRQRSGDGRRSFLPSLFETRAGRWPRKPPRIAHRHAVAGENAGGGADHEETGQRNNGDGSGQRSPSRRPPRPASKLDAN